MYLNKDLILAVFVTILICTTIGKSDKITEERKNCLEPRIFSISQGEIGSFRVDLEEQCDIYVYQIKCLNQSNIIKINSNFTIPTSDENADQRQIHVVFKELAALDEGKKSLVVVNEWTIDGEKSFSSRTTDLTVTVKIKGNWSHSDINFFYEEVEFKNCNEAIDLSQGRSGSFRVDFKEICNNYIYQIKGFNKSSIIKIKSAFTDNSNLTNSKSTGKIQVTFKEFTTLGDGKKSLIIVNKWIVDSRVAASFGDKIFFSRTADLTVTVKIIGYWSHNDFSYEEVEFKEYRKSSNLTREGEISPWVSTEGRGYRPNSVYVFQITKAGDMNANNIDLELKKLQIDEGIGEYVLIGAGKDLFQGPPPLFISSSPTKKRIKIYDENAYIVFVATSTRANYNGFEITWKYNGTRIDKKEEDKIVKRGFLDSSSMPICIFNSSVALNEINKEDSFSRFREKLASLATEYYSEAYSGKKMNIDSSQVRFVRVSGLVKEGEEEGLYVMVNIQHEDGKDVFDWQQMGHILNKYSSLNSSAAVNDYRIKQCPEKPSQQSKWPLYLIAPVLCFICLLIFNWKHTPFPRIFSRQIKHALNRSRGAQRVPAEDNEHATNSEMSPQMGQGNSHAWNRNEAVGGMDSEDEIFNRRVNELRRVYSSRNPSNTNEPKSVRNSTRSTKRAEINEGFQNDEEYRIDIQNAPTTSTNAEESYGDTLNSQKSLLSTHIAEETQF